MLVSFRVLFKFSEGYSRPFHVRCSSPPSPLFPQLRPLYTTPHKFENGALFVLLGLPSTLNRHENGVFFKRSSNRMNLETPELRFNVEGKHFLNRAVQKR